MLAALSGAYDGPLPPLQPMLFPYFCLGATSIQGLMPSYSRRLSTVMC